MTDSSRTYPRDDLLIEPVDLAAQLGSDDILIIDCDAAEVSIGRPHIPGAVQMQIHPYLRDVETNKGVLPPEQATEILSGMGVGNGRRVVCYDSQGGVLAARTWWVLWYYGYENTAVLNGGLIAWVAEGYPLEKEWQPLRPGDFVAAPIPERITNCDLILPQLGSSDFVTLDVRSDLEWSGKPLAQNNQREGHIPGTVHIEWKHFMDWDDNARFKPASEIAAMLESNGVTRGKAVAPY